MFSRIIFAILVWHTVHCFAFRSVLDDGWTVDLSSEEKRNYISEDQADPIVLFHGMGDQCSNKGMAAFTKLLGDELQTYAVCIEIGNGAMTSLSRNFTSQANEACLKLTQDPRLLKNISIVGLSQGALIGRYIIQNCKEFKGTVNRYISIGGPQMGVARIPGCFHGRICNAVSKLVNSLVQSKFIQKNVGPAGYFHNYKQQDKYLKKSVFLPELNYDLDNSTEGFKRLQKTHTMLVMFQQDSMVYPKQSSWFEFFDKNGNLMSFFDTPQYKKLPLQTMFKQQRLTFIRIEGDHLRFTKRDIYDTFIPFLKGQPVKGENI